LSLAESELHETKVSVSNIFCMFRHRNTHFLTEHSQTKGNKYALNRDMNSM